MLSSSGVYTEFPGLSTPTVVSIIKAPKFRFVIVEGEQVGEQEVPM